MSSNLTIIMNLMDEHRILTEHLSRLKSNQGMAKGEDSDKSLCTAIDFKLYYGASVHMYRSDELQALLVDVAIEWMERRVDAIQVVLQNAHDVLNDALNQFLFKGEPTDGIN